MMGFLMLFYLHLLLEVAYIRYLHLHLLKTADEWSKQHFAFDVRSIQLQTLSSAPAMTAAAVYGCR